jgi:hypothetical protein
MASLPGFDDGRAPSAASDHAALAAHLDADAVDAERMAAEWEADGLPAFAARRRDLARRLRARATALRRAAAVEAAKNR